MSLRLLIPTRRCRATFRLPKAYTQNLVSVPPTCLLSGRKIACNLVPVYPMQRGRRMANYQVHLRIANATRKLKPAEPLAKGAPVAVRARTQVVLVSQREDARQGHLEG